MEERIGPSAAADFGPSTAIITLPELGPGGKVLRVEIRNAEFDELIPLLKGLPGGGRDTIAEKEHLAEFGQLDATLDFVKRYDEQAREIVRRWMVSPLVSFDGPKDGQIEWKQLHLRNRIAIVNAISRFSSEGSAGVELATFPALNARGRSDGGGTAGPRENGDSAAPVVSEAQGAPTR